MNKHTQKILNFSNLIARYLTPEFNFFIDKSTLYLRRNDSKYMPINIYIYSGEKKIRFKVKVGLNFCYVMRESAVYLIISKKAQDISFTDNNMSKYHYNKIDFRFLYPTIDQLYSKWTKKRSEVVNSKKGHCMEVSDLKSATNEKIVSNIDNAVISSSIRLYDDDDGLFYNSTLSYYESGSYLLER